MRRKETNKSRAIILTIPRKFPQVLPDGVKENLGVAYKNQVNITECQAFSLAVVNVLVKHC